jgi:hypothetical protein
MPAIRINDRLSIVTGDPEGIIINCLAASDAGVLEIFNVSLFFSSVEFMLESLGRGEPWESADPGLVVSGNSEEITLTFRMQGPPFGQVDVVLNEEDSKKFMDEMSKIAERN